MSRKGLLQREKNRKNIARKYFEKRQKLKNQLKKNPFLEEKFLLHRKLQKLPRNSALIRLNNKCLFSGRSRGFLRYFGISRHFFRELAHEGLLPGVKKSSW